MKEVEKYYPRSKQHWRKWLEKNHVRKDAVWLILYKKSVDKPTVTWSEAVDEALCFGWIDSIRKTVDEECSVQFFSKRKPKSTWSRINKAKIEQLIAEKKMTDAGLACIEIAKQNGSWTTLDEVEDLVIPKDLEKAFRANKGAKKYFLTCSKSIKKMMLHWVTLAKQPETRAKRIKEIAELAAQGKRPKHMPQ